jgi:hypothetical protein
MIRLTVLFLLGSAGVLFSPGVSSAQWGRHGFGFNYGYNYNYGYGFRNPYYGLGNPFYAVPRFGYSYGSSFSINSGLGGFSFGSRYAYSGIVPPVFGLGYSPYVAYAPIYQQGGSYMTGGALVRPDLVVAAGQVLAKAQREASVPDAKAEISGQWNYEKGGNVATDATIPGPSDALRKALDASNPAEIASGDALNELYKEIVRVEAKGAKGPSAYIPALLLDDMRFAGSPAADLLNYARLAGSLPFPAAFDDPTLASVRGELEKDFAAASVAVQAGKSPDSAKVTKLEATLQRAQDAIGPVIKNLPFEDAAAARRFLNRMANAIRGLKGNTAIGLIDPKWAAEGLTVADLVKHMTRHKLLFGAAPRGSEESYTAMHRNFATYLFVLVSPKK